MPALGDNITDLLVILGYSLLVAQHLEPKWVIVWGYFVIIAAHFFSLFV
jgi:hypothetical protein